MACSQKLVFMVSKMEISQLIQTIIVILIFGGIIIYFILLTLYKKKANVKILKKRVTMIKGINSTRSKTMYSPHYTVDCIVGRSSKVKTYTCEMSMYNHFKEGKTYSVLLSINSILKVF